MKKECNAVDHPIYQMLANKTRRRLLQLIACKCENNYGNQLAKILGISVPTAHRQLAFLEGREGKRAPLIEQGTPRHESASGHKGAEVRPYHIKERILTILAIYPNLVNYHVMSNTNGKELEEVSEKDKAFYEVLDFLSAEILQKYDKIEKMTDEISETEKKLFGLFEEKNKEISELVDELEKNYELEYEERKALQVIACLGTTCVDKNEVGLKREVSQILEELVERMTKK
ncbi:MAG: hypothetical protein KAR35_10970 [Candidatus Heimdallarchaeota archaeon]|nr:hypothetical protein [Candidatus Heimdallarchaeota archaeon]MCK5049881.1 hypothetical protein [Candidatus Heimdallarchaeota archaeon]